MINTLLKISKLFWPGLEEMPLPQQLVGVGDVITTLYSSFLCLFGFSWLIKETSINLLAEEWPLFIFFIGIILLFTYLNFFVIIEFREDRYGSANGSFDSMAVWTAAFLLGPTALWLMIIIQIIQFVLILKNLQSTSAKWNNYRALSLTLAGFTLPYLIGLSTYQRLGGKIPIGALNENLLLNALLGILTNFVILILIWAPYFYHVLYTQRQLSTELKLRPVVTFFLLALSLPVIAHPFAILASGLYSQNGVFVFLFFIFGLVMVAYIAQQFSHIAESNRQQSRQLEKLELLGRALLYSPPDASRLSEILENHIPNMFPPSDISVWIIPGQTLYQSPENWDLDFGIIWDWVSNHLETQSLLSNDKLPWEESNESHRPIICTPILAHERNEVIGGIYIELRQLAQPWNLVSMKKLFPALHSLADQISSAIHQAEEYAQSLALQKVGQELQLAGQIQASFLPNKFPKIPGWQLAITLEPAGGLSGDFFDLIPLSRERLGIVIADVADKGLGAALYMALCRTLLRTYAFEYHSRPDLVFSEANERILMDARANLFITCFYGVLDPNEGTLIYCNAGHNPPFLISSQTDNRFHTLERTGMPLGIEEDSRWERKKIDFYPGDKLILYTDGITEAQNEHGDFFSDEKLIEIIQENKHASAFELQNSLLERVKSFVAEAPQFDDITLLILEKEQTELPVKDKKSG